MSIGSLSGIAGAVAGTQLAQTKGSEIDRAHQETGAQALRTAGEKKADAAAGIGQTDGEDHQTGERDADGRRPWEIPLRGGKNEGATAEPPLSKDPSGESGGLLDLSG